MGKRIAKRLAGLGLLAVLVASTLGGCYAPGYGYGPRYAGYHHPHWGWHRGHWR